MFTPTERKIYQLKIKGLGPTRIAHQLGMSYTAVSTHLNNIKKKLEKRADIPVPEPEECYE